MAMSSVCRESYDCPMTIERLGRGGRLRAPAAVLAALCLTGCEPTLNVGEWTCSEAGSTAEPPVSTSAVALPWATGFEQRFCDYTQLAGFCYADPKASYETVTEPVHSGRYAAAFKVDSALTDGRQARCVRQGVLPSAAYYAAWYYVPEPATNFALWNLWHFQGGEPSAPSGLHGLWDVSLVNGTNGALELVVFDFLNGRTRRAANPRPIPIGAWFQVEFYLKRAADNTGEVALYQDGELQLEIKNLRTDDSRWGQWYVGNLASGLTPSEFTLFVDDVTIRATR